MLLSGRPGVIFTKEKIFEILYNEELPESIDNSVYCLSLIHNYDSNTTIYYDT